MIKLLTEYQHLKKQLTDNVGDERSIDELGWNEMIMESIDKLLQDVPEETAKSIRLGHFD